MGLNMVNEDLNDYMFNFIVDICDNIGPRESGTQAEILAGDKIEEEMKSFCDKTYQEEYVSSPTAFLGGVRYGAFLVLVSIIFYWLSLLIDLNIIIISNIWSIIFLVLGILLILITVSYFILEVMRYHESFDFLFPKKKSKNIIGEINPTDQVKNTIIFSAHHDSAYEFNLFYYLKRFGQITINIGYLGVVIVFIMLILKFILNLFSIFLIEFFFVMGIVFICLTPIVFAYMFFHSYNSVLGAFDNLSGVAVVLGIGKFFAENKSNNDVFPKNTKIFLISFAGEEAGLRGAKRFVKEHYEQLKNDETYVINMDSVADLNNIHFLDKEILIGAKHSPEIYSALKKVSDELDIETSIAALPFGATDAAVFSKNGLKATTISGLNLVEELAPFYHTREDTPDVIDKKALGKVVDICVNYFKQIDNIQ
ncbi:MAG: M28 family peptidase [Candidatus Lokiarchaeota archaeon]|nr:M28 family peptidase [Candidatus Lokiarchaeota archaeon]MBD3199063.1 M28 family peptidase [Candidatus Lokiarchaeota archaeon]